MQLNITPQRTKHGSELQAAHDMMQTQLKRHKDELAEVKLKNQALNDVLDGKLPLQI